MPSPSIGITRAHWGVRAPLLLLLAALLATAQAGLPAPWRFLTPQPQGNDLLTAWAAGPDQLYVGGHGGVLIKWDGTTWNPQTVPSQKTIFGIHGVSPTDIWAVGGDPYTEVITNRCLILHYDGAAWREIAPPQFSGYTYTLNAVHALAADDVWATQDGGTFLVHNDGKKWDWFSVPLAVEGTFKAVTSVGTNHLYVAGTHGQILHRDHGTWKLEQKLETGNISYNIISRLWAFDADTVFAAGNWTQFYRRKADGTWASLPVGSSEPFGIGFLGLWGRSPTEVYLMSPDSVFRYDGVNPAVRTSFFNQMRRQWFAGCGAGDRLYGVGPAGVAHEYLLNDQGGGVLAPLTVGGQAEMDFTPAGLVACGPDEALAFGFAHEGPGRWPLWHLAHGVARPFPSLPPGATRPTSCKAVAATSLQDVIVAWENFQDWQRGVHRWDGGQWQALPGAEGTLAFWRSPSGRLHAAGPARVQFWNGAGAWETLYTLPVDQPDHLINALWGRADNDIFAGTVKGRVLHYNGTTWKVETTPGAGVITGLAGTGADTYAVGQDGLAWRRSGTSWQPLTGVAAKSGEAFTAIVTGSDAVYAAQSTPAQYTGGGLGRLWRFNGATATLVLQGLSQPLAGLGRTTTGHLVGFAARDFIITDEPQLAPPTLQRLNLAAGAWQPVGTTGVALRSENPVTARPMIAVQRVEAPAPFGPDPAPYGAHWVILEDRFFAGTAIPPLQVQMHYDPAQLGAGLAGQPLNLYRHTDAGFTEVPCLHDAVAHTLTTTAPVDFSIWTVGPSTVVPPPALQVARAAGQRVTLAWPAAATGFVLESATELSPTGLWAPAPETPQLTGGQAVVTLDGTGGQRFFRLRRAGN